MKLSHAPELALVGFLFGCAAFDAPVFYLMTAPTVPGKGPDVTAPITSWSRMKTFDQGMDLGLQCWGAEQDWTRSHPAVSVYNPETQKMEDKRTVAYIPSDDPRLKEK